VHKTCVISRILPGSVVATLLSLGKLFRLSIVAFVVLSAILFGGPITSGAVFLLLPAPHPAVDHDLPADYEPVHKGGVDLATGLYVRENEDLIVRGTPALILRRTYLSRYRVSKEFGIGTTHAGEQYLIGDGQRFQWVSLIQANGSRVTFTRTSPGSFLVNAMYEHVSTPSEWRKARLGWTGRWSLRRADGTLLTFQSCGQGAAGVCSIVQSRDADGHAIYYRRDRSGRLLKMEAGDRWIAFDYDAQGRVTRAHASTSQHVRYEYDEPGRLRIVTSSEGTVRRYTYTDRDELATISEPGVSIENIYKNDRVARQINRFDDDPDPLTFDFTYHAVGNDVVRTDTRRSDGTWSQYTWSENRYATSEIWGHDGAVPATFTYERDPATNLVSALTLTCPDRTGRPLRHSSLVRPNNEDWRKWDMLQTHCSWRVRKPRPEHTTPR